MTVDDYRLVIVMAGNAHEAEGWRRKEGLSPREFIYASSPQVVEGTRPTRIVILDGFRYVQGERALQIEESVRCEIIKLKDPIKIEYPTESR